MVSFGEYDEVELKDGRTGTIVLIVPDKKASLLTLATIGIWSCPRDCKSIKKKPNRLIL